MSTHVLNAPIPQFGRHFWGQLESISEFPLEGIAGSGNLTKTTCLQCGSILKARFGFKLNYQGKEAPPGITMRIFWVFKPPGINHYTLIDQFAELESCDEVIMEKALK